MRRGYFTPPVLIILAIIIFAVAILIAINTDLVKRIKKEPLPAIQTPPNLIVEKETNWDPYYLSKMEVGDTTIIASFRDSKGIEKFIISKAVLEKESDLKGEEIYLANSQNLVNARKILELGSQSIIVNKPQISRNQNGTKYFVIEIDGPGDGDTTPIYDERGNEIQLDTSSFEDKEVSSFGFTQWEDDSTIFILDISSYGDYDYQYLFDAATGKPVGEFKTVKRE